MSSLTPVTITHSSGASATIHPFGATVTSFITSSQKETLFVSRLAKTDGSKAIRGGIPLAFPQFGRPDESMPQHGFFRCNAWTFGKEFDEEGGLKCCDFTLSLADVTAARGGRWAAGTALDFTAVLTVKIDASQLITNLTVTNTGGESFPFQALFHTYYAVADDKAMDPSVCNVTGLEGYDAEDKVTGDEYVQCGKPIVLGKEVDRIYSNSSKPELDVTISTGSTVSLTASASVDGATTPVSVVVWNPYIEKAKALGDFGDEQYNQMICVEPGVLKDVPVLEGGKVAVFEQVISVL
jgi:glucose-6-phosphate 1-epimerase